MTHCTATGSVLLGTQVSRTVFLSIFQLVNADFGWFHGNWWLHVDTSVLFFLGEYVFHSWKLVSNHLIISINCRSRRDYFRLCYPSGLIPFFFFCPLSLEIFLFRHLFLFMTSDGFEPTHVVRSILVSSCPWVYRRYIKVYQEISIISRYIDPCD